MSSGDTCNEIACLMRLIDKRWHWYVIMTLIQNWLMLSNDPSKSVRSVNHASVCIWKQLPIAVVQQLIHDKQATGI